MSDSTIFVAGTFDTKSAELGYLADVLKNAGVSVKTIDLSATGNASKADVSPQAVAALHPQGESAVFTGDRATSFLL